MSKTKKKGNGLIAVIVTLAIFIAAVGTAIGLTRKVADKFLLQYTGYSLKECQSVLKGIKDDNVKKIEKSIDNPYREEDLNGFYTSIKETLFLDDEFTLDTDTIYNLAFPDRSDAEVENIRSYNQRALSTYGLDEKDLVGANGEDKSDEKEEDKQEEIGEENGEGDNNNNENDNNENNSAITELLYNLLNHIDKDKLYNDDIAEVERKLNLTITDRQIAAFVNAFLKKMLSDEDGPVMKNVADTLSQYGIKLDEAFNLHQISFYQKPDSDIIKLKATVSVKLRDLAKNYVNNYFKTNNIDLPWIVKGLVNTILLNIPKATYATVDIGLTEDDGFNLNLNRMDGEKMDILYGLISKFSHKDVKAELDTTFSNALGSFYTTVNNTVDIASFLTAEHTIQVPVFDMALDATINKQLSGDNTDGIKMRDIIELMRSEVNVPEEYDFRNWYHKVPGDSEDDWVYAVEKDWQKDQSGNWVYVGEEHFEGVTLSKENVVKFQDEFLNELKVKYGLKPELTFDEVISTLLGDNNSSGNTAEKVIEMFDAKTLQEKLSSNSVAPVEIKDRMIAAIIDNQKGKLLGDNDMASAIELAYVALTEKNVNNKNHNLIEIGLTVNLHELIGKAMGEDNNLTGIITNLMPEKMMIKAIDVDITQGLQEEDDYLDMKIGLNDLDDVDKFMNIIQNLAGFDKSKLNEVAKSVRDIIASMSSVIPVELGTSEIVIPQIYETLAYVLYNQLGEEDKIDIDKGEIEASLRALFGSFDYDPFYENEEEKQAKKAALENKVKEYYPIKDGGIDVLIGLMKDNGSIDIENLIDPSAMQNTVKSYGGSIDNSGAIEEYLNGKRLMLDGENILTLVTDILDDAMDDFADASPEIASLTLNRDGRKDFVTISMYVSLSGFINDDDNNVVMKFLKDLIPDKTKIEITVDVTHDAAEREDPTIKINDKDGDTLLDLMEKFGSGNQADGIKTKISDAAVNAFESIRNNIEIEFVKTQQETELRLPDIFDLAATQLDKDNGLAFEGNSGRVNLFLAVNVMVNPALKPEEFKGISDKGEENVVNKIKSAYYLKSDADTFDALSNEIGNTPDVLSIIDTDGIFYEDPEENVKLSVADIGAIFKKNLPDGSDFGKIVSVEMSTDKKIIAIMEIDFGKMFEGSQDIMALLPEDFIYVEGIIDTSSSEYSTEFGINGYSGDELKALYGVIEKLGIADASGMIEDKGRDVSESVKTAFDNMKKIMDFEFSGDGIVLPNVFGFIKNNVGALKNSDYNEAQIQEAIQGLYSIKNKPSEKHGTEFNFDEDKFFDNKIPQELIDSPYDLSNVGTQLLSGKDTIRVTDRQLGSFINQKVQQTLTVSQFNILTQNIDQKTIEGFKGDLNGQEKVLLLLTVEMNFAEIGLTDAGNADNLLPQKIYVTFALTPGESNKLEYKAFRINDMSSEAQDVLLKMANIDADTANSKIKEHADTCCGYVNDVITAIPSAMAEISYESVIDTEEGVGVLQFKKKI